MMGYSVYRTLIVSGHQYVLHIGTYVRTYNSTYNTYRLLEYNVLCVVRVLYLDKTFCSLHYLFVLYLGLFTYII